MTDITVAWNNATGWGDWSIAQGELTTGNDLTSAIIVSLFTDRRAPASDTAHAADPRGWWGDTFSPTPWGSRLWLLFRAEISDHAQLLRTAQDYCNEALQWLIDDGVAASVVTVCTWLSSNALGFSITVTEPTVTPPTIFEFSWAWASIGAGGN